MFHQRFHLPTSLLMLICTIISTGCSVKSNQLTESNEKEIADITLNAEEYADSIIATLDSIQKIAQMVMPAVMTDSDGATITAIKNYAKMGVGGIILLKGDIKSAQILIDTLISSSKLYPFVAIDAEWGLGMRLADAPKFPLNADLDSLITEQTMFDYGREVAEESRKLGINMILGPVLDISAKDGFIGRRSLGTNPERVSDLAIAYACGLESGNVMSVAKHFPGHGAASGDSHKKLPMISKSLQSLDSIDLQPFRTYIRNGLSGIMIGHLAFPAIDPEGLPAALSKPVITNLLREDIGFKGLILTDALNMEGALGLGADKAVEAGSDVILAPANTQIEINNIYSAIKSGTLSMQDIDAHLKRIFIRKYFLNSGHHSGTISPDSIYTSNTRSIQKKLRPRSKRSL